MPGAYAHITLVNLLKETRRLQALDIPAEVATALLDYFKFVELGAVSPDYPYLSLRDKAAARWADAMHYDRTGETIQLGARRLRGMQGEPKRKGIAWLLGYAAHVATDVTIHPVVELKVGPYKGHKKAHRVCEMHQDSYIFQRLDLGGIGLAEHLDRGICACGTAGAKGIDPDIRVLWQSMLEGAHAGEARTNPPNLDKWHRGFKTVVDDIGEEGNRLLPIARHVAVGLGLTYPAPKDIDPQYIKHLQVPNGRQDYDRIFDFAINNVGQVWSWLAKGIMNADEPMLARLGNWNLDTGRENGRLVFWS